MDEGNYKKSKSDEFLAESLRKIKEQEEKMLQEIEEKRESMLEQIRQEGKEMAIAEAKIELKKEVEHVFEEANRWYAKGNQHLQLLNQEAENIKNHYLEEKKEEILQLSIEMARRIVQKEIELDHSLLNGMYEEARNQIRYETRKIYVRLHPLSEEVLNQNETLKVDKRIEFLIDMTMQPGDFVLETDRECVDMSINMQLNQIKDCLRGAFS